jgi:hypothetical protein
MIYAHCFACGESWGIGMPRTCKCPNQEQDAKPTAWADMLTKDVNNDAGLSWTPGHFHTTPLYEHPKEWQDLMDDEIHETPFALFEVDQNGMSASEALLEFARAIEYKFKEKNT